MGSHSRWRWSDYRRVCRTSTEALGRVLDAAEDASPLEAVEAVTADLSAALKASAAFFLIADVSGRGLVRLSQASADPVGVRAELGGSGGRPRLDDDEQAVDLPVAGGGAAAEALRTQTVQVLPPGGRGREGERWEVLAPVTERGEALGLLQLSLPREPNAAVLSEIARIAHLLSFVVIANRRHTDLFEWAQRSALFTLPAEIQRRLLPAAFTCEAGALTLSAWLEPAASIGGDTFDYSLARDVLHLSVTDAMGHGVASALTATLCVGSLRNTRRMGGTLLEQAAAANRALVEDGSERASEAFVTGLLGRLDLRTGTLALVNAGHVAPYLCRDGTVTPLRASGEPPAGPVRRHRLREHRPRARARRPAGGGHRRHARAGRGHPRPDRRDRADPGAPSARDHTPADRQGPSDLRAHPGR